jgi:hypothetical protein
MITRIIAVIVYLSIDDHRNRRERIAKMFLFGMAGKKRKHDEN